MPPSFQLAPRSALRVTLVCLAFSLPLAFGSQGRPDLAAAEAVTARGAAAVQRGDPSTARRDYVQAVLLFQKALSAPHPPLLNPAASLAYATALAATGDSPAAESILQSAVTANPASAPLEDALGTVLAQSGQLGLAVPHFERATALDSALPLAQYHLGVARLALDQPAEALAPLQRAAAAMPQAFDVHLQYGRALSATNDDAAALPQLRQALSLRSSASPPAALNLLALALQASGDPAAALPLFAQLTAAPNKPDSSLLTNYALARVQTGDATGALALYARALALGPDTPTLREDYGAAYLQKQDLNHALVEFRAGLALDAANAHLHYDTGLALKLQDDLAEAIPEFQRAAELDPQLPDPPYTLGVIYMQQGRAAEAAAQLQRATTLAPQNGDAWALLGSVLKDNGDAPAATEALRRAIALEPEQPSLHIQLAALESQAGDSAAAAADRRVAAGLSRAANAHQRASFALRSGRALLGENKLPEAVLQLSTAAQADPALAEPHRLLADAYTRQGHAAAAALERAKAAELGQTPAGKP